jgi:transposase InsO family protein
LGWALPEKPDAELVIKALDMAYEQRGRPQGLLFHSGSMRAAYFASGSGVIAFVRA